jgi:hypothetical protein
MVHNFSEIVIKGPFFLVKGFLMGYLYASSKKFEYFFHRKSGIRRETLKDLIREYFEFENYVHLCMENNVVPKFLSAIEKSYEKIGLSVESVRNIQLARFSFSYEVFSENLSRELKLLFLQEKNGLKIIDYKPTEQKCKDAGGVEGYAPIHSYISEGSGKVEGNFYPVMQLFLSLKKSSASNFITCSDISLQLEE